MFFITSPGDHTFAFVESPPAIAIHFRPPFSLPRHPPHVIPPISQDLLSTGLRVCARPGCRLLKWLMPEHRVLSVPSKLAPHCSLLVQCLSDASSERGPEDWGEPDRH